MRRSTCLFALLCVATAVGLPASPAAAAPPARDPVIIVAGTFEPTFVEQGLAYRLGKAGYAVTIFSLPDSGAGDIRTAAAALGTYVDGVRAGTGAGRVDLVTHSQGGLVARSYVKDFGGSQYVDSMVLLGPPDHGIPSANIATLLGVGDCFGVVACQQMAIGSDFLAQLNDGPDVIAPTRVTTIATVDDELIEPPSTAALADGATNVVVQSQCWFRVIDHVGLLFDGAVADGVKDALAGQPVRLNCFAV